jgi:hypothetical protein
MFQVINLLLLLLVILAPATTLFAESNCSLKVQVLSPRGDEVEALVTVTESTGRALKKENQVGGIGFCDLGVLPVTVVVGKGTCNQVTVQGVQLSWRETVVVKVIYDVEPCMHDAPPSPEPSCSVLLRMADMKQQWLSGARVKLTAPLERDYTADEFGRVMLGAKHGPDLKGLILQPGFRTKEFRFPCSRGQSLQEHVLVLESDLK